MLKIFKKINFTQFFWGIDAIAYKEFIHVLNDRFTLSLSLIIPALQLIIYGYAIDMDVKHIKSGVLDQDKTNYSKLVIDKLSASKYFDFIYFAENESNLLDNIINGKIKTGLIIPKDFQSDFLHKRDTSVQLLIDGSESSVAQQASNAASLVGLNFNPRIIPQHSAKPIPNANFLEVRTRVLFNPDLKSANFMIPGLIGVLMQIITAFLTALAIVKEKEKGTLEQLMVTPVGQGGLLFGKLAPYFIIGILQYFLICFLMTVLFKVPIRGSFILLTLLSIIFLFTSLSIGLLISTYSENLAQTSQLLQFLIIPSILLSGFIFPRENMPLPMNIIGYFIPLTYFLEILRGIIIRGCSFSHLIPNIIPLLLYGITIMTFAIRRFKKHIA